MPGTARQIISNLVNRTKGLDEIHDDVNTLDGIVDVPTKDSTDDVQMSDVVGKKDDTAVAAVGTTKTIVAYTKGIMNDLSNATDGLGALKSLTDGVETKVDTLTTNVGTVDTVVDGIQTDLSNATDGLGALKTLIDTVDALVSPAEIISNIFDVDMGYWTEVDVGADRVTIDYTNERIAIADLDSDEDVYVYKATDANVDDFILDFEFQVLNTTVVGSRFGIGLADGVGTMEDVGNGLYARLIFSGANNSQINITHMTSGSTTYSTSIENLADDTTYYGRLIRRGLYCWLGIYSDRIRETHVTGSPVEYKDWTPVAFTHLYAMAAEDDGTTGKAMDAYVEAIKLISAPDIDKYIGRHIT